MKSIRYLALPVFILLMVDTALAASVLNLPTIAPARLGIIDSRTFTNYLEKEKNFDRLIPLLKQELNTVKLTEIEFKMGVTPTPKAVKVINEVFAKYGSKDPWGDFLRLRQYDGENNRYDPEGKLYLLDDLAHIYTYGLVNFRLAGQYNRKAGRLYKELSRLNLDNLPTSDYYNSRRSLYNTFSYRMAEQGFFKVVPKDNPPGFSLFPGRIDLITPFSKPYLHAVRKLDLQKVGKRIDARRQFLQLKLGEATTVEKKKQTKQTPSDMNYQRALQDRLRQFIDKIPEYGSLERSLLVTQTAYDSYVESGNDTYLTDIVTYGKPIPIPDEYDARFYHNAMNQIHYRLGFSYLKMGDTAQGIQYVERFLKGIDSYEEAVNTSFERRTALVESINREQKKESDRDAAWSKVFAFAQIAASLYGFASSAGVGQGGMRQLYLESFRMAGQSLVNLRIDRFVEKTQMNLRDEVAKFVTPYSLKVNRYLDKFEMINFFLAVGNGYESQNQLEKALTQYEETIRIVERQRTTILTERQRVSFFATKQRVYDSIIKLLVRLNRPHTALEYVERAKSRAFVDILGSSRIKLKNKKQDKAFLSTLRTQAEIDALLSDRNIGTSQINYLIDKRKRGIKIKAKKPETMVDLELQSFSSVGTMNADEIMQATGKDTTLLEYYLAKDELIIFLVQKDRIESIPIAIDRRQLVADANAFRENIKNRQDCRLRSKGLYDLLIAPVKHKIDSAQLIIIPHGVLHYLPFQALYDGQQYLVERYAISSAPSTTVLGFNETRSSVGNGKALIVGNPTLDLRFAEKEAVDIAGLFPEATLLTREKGTETFVKNQANGYEFIHLATHGAYDDQKPLNSRILLGSDDLNDGPLTMAELFAANWQASLVTLSACETGLSKYQSGDELIGLQRGLMFAGTRSILSSLWSVDDEATGFLMASFYRNLKTMPKNFALQQAAMATIRKFEHPFYWAAFNLIGARV